MLLLDDLLIINLESKLDVFQNNVANIVYYEKLKETNNEYLIISKKFFENLKSK